MLFWLGTHQANWLNYSGEVPLFISAVRLRRFSKSLPKAKFFWALDSGGFSEIAKHGRWTIGPAQYAKEVKYWSKKIGNLVWAATQDWMCEPFMLAKTGKTIQEHQELTVKSYLDLSSLASEIYWMPVLQGWEIDDYLAHVDMYAKSGVDLIRLPLVGLGSVCRRQATSVASDLVAQLFLAGIKLHAFGFKLTGLENCGSKLSSSDSMAWSFDARYANPLPGCTHKNCANCYRYAVLWRGRVLEIMKGLNHAA